MSELPRWKCHKEVQAAKIVEINRPDRRLAVQISTDQTCGFSLPKTWFEKHDPHVGGYLVRYDDGYASFSPAKAFEDGYTRIADEE